MKIAIAGYGIEGRANFDYFNTPENELTIVDEREYIDNLPEGASEMLGHGAFSKLDGFDMVVRTASLNPGKIKTDGKIWSSTNEFFDKCPAPIIGVTGTKGKGTTCSFIASILRAAGKNVHLVGNIGTAPLSVLADISVDDIVVFELSSFQLWDAKFSPHVAVVLPIEPDHLDIHASFEDYIAAKANIVRYQTEKDVVVYHERNSYSLAIAEKTPAEKRSYPFSLGSMAEAVVLPGFHNQHNAAAAIAAIRDYVQDEVVIKEGLRAFTGLPHRLKFVAEKHRIKYYDDSIATTPGSAMAALESFKEPKYLILGGHDKGADYTDLFKIIKLTDAKLILMGANRQDLANLARGGRIEHIVVDGDMNDVVQTAATTAEPGSVVILSPAAASFDMFKSYSARGDAFVDAVKVL